MRLRATWATLLTVMMLSLSVVASACEIQCGLKSASPGCHGRSRQSPSQQGKEMPAMADMGHAAIDDAAASHPAIVVQPPACSHRLCMQEPAFSTNRDELAVHAICSVQVAALIEATVIPAVPGRSHSVPGAPHLRISCPVALHTTLRV